MTARLQLAKVPLCLLIGCATFFGTVLANPVADFKTLFFVPIGVFIVATGAASLNSLQELQQDGRMMRTRNRPLPAGLLTPSQAGWQAAILIMGGLLTIIAGSAGFLPVAVTIAAVILYNGVYTPLKQKSVLAIIPGSLCGALPSCIGWFAGGGGAEPTVILIVSLFVLWQIPHFWLVLLTYREDYTDSSLPNVLRQFDEKTLRRILTSWIGALSFVMLMFAILPYQVPTAVRWGVIANALFLPAFFFYWLGVRKQSSYRVLFVALNCILFLHMALLCAGRIFSVE